VQDLRGRVAVVTGGAGGIGRGIVEALLEEGARVVIGDVEEPALDMTVGELSERGEIRGVRTDVSDLQSVDALARSVYENEGACHLLFNNAGVTSGGGGKPWEQESNDWRWCYSVNVFGVAHGVLAFVPRMLESGEPGVVVNTSSQDGGIAPSGGLLETGLWTAQRNRPPELARTRERAPAPGTTFEEFKQQLAAAGRPTDTVDLTELGRFLIQGIKDGKFVISYGLEEAADLLHARADAIAKGDLPPAARL